MMAIFGCSFTFWLPNRVISFKDDNLSVCSSWKDRACCFCFLTLWCMHIHVSCKHCQLTQEVYQSHPTLAQKLTALEELFCFSHTLSTVSLWKDFWKGLLVLGGIVWQCDNLRTRYHSFFFFFLLYHFSGTSYFLIWNYTPHIFK